MDTSAIIPGPNISQCNAAGAASHLPLEACQLCVYSVEDAVSHLRRVLQGQTIVTWTIRSFCETTRTTVQAHAAGIGRGRTHHAGHLQHVHDPSVLLDSSLAVASGPLQGLIRHLDSSYQRSAAFSRRRCRA